MLAKAFDSTMIGRTDSAAEKKKRDGVKRVVEWLEDLLPEEEKDEEFGGKAPPGKETNVICNQLECKEPGCPPVELVMTLLRAKPKQKLMFKIFKAASEVTREEVRCIPATTTDILCITCPHWRAHIPRGVQVHAVKGKLSTGGLQGLPCVFESCTARTAVCFP